MPEKFVKYNFHKYFNFTLFYGKIKQKSELYYIFISLIGLKIEFITSEISYLPFGETGSFTTADGCQVRRLDLPSSLTFTGLILVRCSSAS